MFDLELSERSAEERRRYTSRLQRRVKARVTSELGIDMVAEGIDRQIAMVLQHSIELTNARRATFFRPIARAKRWQTVTVLEDGGFHYGLIAPESVPLAMLAATDREPVLIGPEHDARLPFAMPEDPGFTSYVAMPLVAADHLVGVLEIIDLGEPKQLGRAVENLRATLDDLSQGLGNESLLETQGSATLPTRHDLTDETVLDLVLHPPVDEDATFTVSPDEWAILMHLDGERTVIGIARTARLPRDEVVHRAARLLERGLIRIGRENRRR